MRIPHHIRLQPQDVHLSQYTVQWPALAEFYLKCPCLVKTSAPIFSACFSDFEPVLLLYQYQHSMDSRMIMHFVFVFSSPGGTSLCSSTSLHVKTGGLNPEAIGRLWCWYEECSASMGNRRSNSVHFRKPLESKKPLVQRQKHMDLSF